LAHWEFELEKDSEVSNLVGDLMEEHRHRCNQTKFVVCHVGNTDAETIGEVVDQVAKQWNDCEWFEAQLFIFILVLFFVFTVVLRFMRLGVGVGVRIAAEILMHYFFKQEKNPYSNDDDKILVHCGWVMVMTSMWMVVAVTRMRVVVGLTVVLIATRAHVRQSVEEYISKQTAKGKTEQDMCEGIPVLCRDTHIHQVDKKDRYHRDECSTDERLGEEGKRSHKRVDFV
jgi:hypothetical protein